jgi:hypothetical protein
VQSYRGEPTEGVISFSLDGPRSCLPLDSGPGMPPGGPRERPKHGLLHRAGLGLGQAKKESFKLGQQAACASLAVTKDHNLLSIYTIKTNPTKLIILNLLAPRHPLILCN